MRGPMPFLLNPNTGRAIPGTPAARALFWQRFWARFRAYQGGGAGSVARSFCCFLAEVACDVFIELERMADAGLKTVDEAEVGRAFDLAPEVVENMGAVPRVIAEREEAKVQAYNPRNHPRCSCYDLNPGMVLCYPSAEARRNVMDFLVEIQEGLEARVEPLPLNVEANLLLWVAEEADSGIVAGGCGPDSVPSSLSAARAAMPAMERRLLSGAIDKSRA